MKSFKLRFGEIIIMEPSLAEVIINSDITMDEGLVDEYHDFLLKNLKAPFSLLINKKNPYSYTFEAQKIIANLREIDSMAVVIHTKVTEMATKILIDVNKDNDWKIKLFSTRVEALEWLKNQ